MSSVSERIAQLSLSQYRSFARVLYNHRNSKMSAARGVTHSLFKRAWNEIPDVVGGSALAVAGLVMAGIGLTKYYANDKDNRRYKMGYVVMRPDDPRAEKVHKD